ncbi:PHD-finger family protein [Histomonas meleagridis]|uniref:PHD-finger family protein n=1 Tax=Histomonas meleagridis TaxID=135588 RepID=UPI003559917A|nr:PHD-finger family protein [Histomonas meleagridis]KAH0802228.1 PHD-finger family protein [Histomonas meleagridis]
MESKSEAAKKLITKTLSDPSIIKPPTTHLERTKGFISTGDLDAESQIILDFAAQRVEAARSLVEILNNAEEEIMKEIRLTESSLIETHKLKDGSLIGETPFPIPANTTPDDHFCICRGQQVGDMVSCDNPSCPFQWFHIECVGLRALPESSWFCPCCASLLRKVETMDEEINQEIEEQN